jgi:hypothetical protein
MGQGEAEMVKSTLTIRESPLISIRILVVSAVAVLLSWGSTVAINKLYNFGGHPVQSEQLNPVLIQTYPPVPADARLFLTIRCPKFSSEAILQVNDRAVTGTRPNLEVRPTFASQLQHEGDYELYIKPIKVRGFVQVSQNPSAANGYTAEIKVFDPYSGDSDYEFQIWSRTSN